MITATSNVRISPLAAVALDKLSERLGKSKSGVVEEALRVLEAQTFAADVQEAYRKLRADDVAWKDYTEEVAVWDRLAGDGLPPNGEW